MKPLFLLNQYLLPRVSRHSSQSLSLFIVPSLFLDEEGILAGSKPYDACNGAAPWVLPTMCKVLLPVMLFTLESTIS